MGFIGGQSRAAGFGPRVCVDIPMNALLKDVMVIGFGQRFVSINLSFNQNKCTKNMFSEIGHF